jgi:hypothetical protein
MMASIMHSFVMNKQSNRHPEVRAAFGEPRRMLMVSAWQFILRGLAALGTSG